MSSAENTEADLLARKLFFMTVGGTIAFIAVVIAFVLN